MAVTPAQILPIRTNPQPTHTALTRVALSPPKITPRTAIPRSSVSNTGIAGAGTRTEQSGDMSGAGGNISSATSSSGAATSDQSNAGADAQALTDLLSVYQSAFGGGGGAGGGAPAGELIATPTNGADTTAGTGTSSASINFTSLILFGIVAAAAYFAYRHFKNKGAAAGKAAAGAA